MPYTPTNHRNESALRSEMERLAHDARSIRRTIEHARSEADKRVLNRQLTEIQLRMDVLSSLLR